MKRAATSLIVCLIVQSLCAQMWDQLARSSYRIRQSDLRALRVEVDALTFFRDNEYSSKLTKGYSLPGLWLEPKLVYTPLSQIELELGAHALIFNGANKYPCYVYHDVGRWKGSQHQHGAHALPWLRAKADFRHLTVVMGDIYGGQNHRLSIPLWNAEANLSQDPEMGFQLLWDRNKIGTSGIWDCHMDTWLNWQSYIFEEDSHQEAFTVGSAWKVGFLSPWSKVRWYMPLQLVIQHRGGEQDTTSMGVQTLCNASVGLGMHWYPTTRTVKRVNAEASVLATYQQSGTLWPFDTGVAYHLTAGADFRRGISLRGGLRHGQPLLLHTQRARQGEPPGHHHGLPAGRLPLHLPPRLRAGSRGRGIPMLAGAKHAAPEERRTELLLRHLPTPAPQHIAQEVVTAI